MDVLFYQHYTRGVSMGAVTLSEVSGAFCALGNGGGVGDLAVYAGLVLVMALGIAACMIAGDRGNV